MQLQTRVLGPVLSYLPTVSPYLPDCKATRRVWMQMTVRPFGGSIAQGWTDRDWQQVRRKCNPCNNMRQQFVMGM